MVVSKKNNLLHHSVSFRMTSTKSRTVGRRSTSLPCRFDPFISHLEDESRALRECCHNSQWQQSPTSICEGLARLDPLHISLLDDVLQQPQAQDSLHRRPEWANCLLDDFLRLADAYSTFRSAIISLKQEQSATQAAIRRKDCLRTTACLRSQKRIEKEIVKVAASMRWKDGKWTAASNAAEAEHVGITREVVAVTAAVSEAVFSGIVRLSSSSCSPYRAHSIMGPMVRKLASLSKKDDEEEEENKWRTNALEKLETLEKCLEEVEVIIEKLFRSLISTRVFLLNVLTPTL